MYIKGEFRDVVKRSGEVIEDRGWKSNNIVPDFGKFLAAVMKKDFINADKDPICIGIEYLAVGGGNGNEENFRGNIGKFFENIESNSTEPYHDGSTWAWAKKILPDYMKYDGNKITNTLQIEITFDDDDPKSENPLNFEELSLVGYNRYGTSQEPGEPILFFINYATHGVITKSKGMTVTRTIKLTFPIKQV